MGQARTTTRVRRITLTALGVSAAAALAVPGAAWAATGVPTGDPVTAIASALSAGSSDATTTSACPATLVQVSDADMRKLLGGGLALTEEAGAYKLDLDRSEAMTLELDGANVIEITPQHC